MSPPPIIPYQTPVKTHPLAVAALALALGSVPIFFLIFPLALAFLFSLIAMRCVSGTMDTRGQRYALLATRISGYGLLVATIFYILMPSPLGPRNISSRSVCA